MESERVSVTIEDKSKDSILKKNNSKTKLKKLRSIKLNKQPSFRSSSSSPSMSRKSKTHLRNIIVDFPSDEESPLCSSTSSSQLSVLSQKSTPTLKRSSSFNNKGVVRTLTRMYSKKQKKPVNKINKKSTKPENSELSSNSSSNLVKESPRDSEFSFAAKSTIDRTNKRTLNLTRKSSLRASRVSTKMKTKISTVIHDPGVERPTCSSALKDSKMADSAVQIESRLGGEEEEAHSAMKVCPFSYCSLHGHRHKDAPPLKRLISIRRRLLKNDRTAKVEDCNKDKPRGNKVNRGIQTNLVEEDDAWVEAESIESCDESEEVKIEENLNLTEDCICESGSVSGDEIAESLSKSASTSESLGELENEEKQPEKGEMENLETGQRFFRFPPKQSEPDSPNNAGIRVQLKDQKYVKMWRLMYKHAVKEVPAENEEKLEQQLAEERVLPEEDDRDKTSQIDRESVKESYQNQIEAVNLVQKAFDEILLPEIQGQGQVVGGEENAKEVKTGSMDLGEKTFEQSGSKKWSALKKIFILKRFVKALDKVKQIQRGTIRYLPLQPEPGAERVSLRRQTSEERKNSDDWMLDFALRQVVSKLDPDQQRQVAMLVKAFETILPIPDSLNSPSPRLIVRNRSRVSQSDGNGESLRMVSRGQGTNFVEAESGEKEQDLDNRSMIDKKPESDATVISGNLEDKSVSELSTQDDAQAEKQSYMRLWGFVYTHMMESIPGESEGKKVENVKTTIQIFPIKGDGKTISDDKAILRRIQAIKLIEKAIDDIILPENQDSRSPPGSDEEPRTIIINKVEEKEKVKEEEKKEKACTVKEEGKAGPLEKRSSKNWSNLKQKILLRRFIKAFDNARKLSFSGPRFLEAQAEAEAERVRLRHQEVGERKSGEEWMVDHALQQAVARLTPDRKKKVHLLVQAFEAVKT